MPLLLALATVALPTPAQATDLRCVAVLAIVANAQRRGAGWRDVDDVQRDGPEFAAIVGDDVMTATGMTREAVRDGMLAAVASVRKAKGPLRADVATCMATMHARIAQARVPDTAPVAAR